MSSQCLHLPPPYPRAKVSLCPVLVLYHSYTIPFPQPKAIKGSGGQETARVSVRSLELMGLGPMGVLEEVTPVLSACVLCKMGVLEAAEQLQMCVPSPPSC